MEPRAARIVVPTLAELAADCTCTDCTLDAQGNCIIDINITGPAAPETVLVTNLQIGMCLAKNQTCTYNFTTGEQGRCYDNGSDNTLDCLKTCPGGTDAECGSPAEWDCCTDTYTCVAQGVNCPLACGTIGYACCVNNKCLDEDSTCLCVADQAEPECVNTTLTSKYRIFNYTNLTTSTINKFTWENTTSGKVHSCCLSSDNTSCRGWLNITAS